MAVNMANYLGLTEKELSYYRDIGCTEEQIAKMNQRKLDEIHEQLKKCTLKIANHRSKAWEGKEVRLVLLGRTGAGKSALGNLIIGKEAFEESFRSESCTATIKEESAMVDGVRVRIIDTPGFHDTRRSAEEILTEIAKVLDAFADGIHGFLFVFNAASHRFTAEQKKAFEQIEKGLLGPSFMNWCYLVMSHGNAIAKHCSLEDYLNGEMSSTFGKLAQKLKDRIILTETDNDDSLKQLLREQVVRLVQHTMTRIVIHMKTTHWKQMEEMVAECVRQLVPLIEEELSRHLQDIPYQELSRLQGKRFDRIAERVFQKVKVAKEEGVPDKPLLEAVQSLFYAKKERLTNSTFLERLKAFAEPLLEAAGIFGRVLAEFFSRRR